MKNTLTLVSLLILCCSCGTTHQAPSNNQDEVNIGYGTISKDKNTYAVSKVKIDEKTINTFSDMYEYLQGKVPGVVVSGTKIIIRGLGTNGNSDPLILLDGIECDDLSIIDPNSVASVEVLKDGSSAIYGARGANGVLMITTKK